jgi:restriction system protein
MADLTVWGIHSGREGQADELFLKKGVIAVGWADLGDVSKLPADREAFKDLVRKTYGDGIKTSAIPGRAGLFYRFVHEVKEGDLVVFPCRRDRQVHLGRVQGGYKFDPGVNAHFPHQHAVRWLKSVPRVSFTQGALYEVGSALAFFQVKTYADEFRTAVDETPVAPPTSQDESVELVAEDIEQTTRDFVLKTLSQELKGHPFAAFVAHLLNVMGYQTRLSPPGPDGGIDIIAHKDVLGFEPPIIKVQVKSTGGTVGDPEVSSLYGKVSPGEHGLLVTLGVFSGQAKSFGKSKANLRLIDGEELVDLVLTHYERLDSKYKGILPLKRVYVPEALPDDE